jgi:hypothetical protein
MNDMEMCLRWALDRLRAATDKQEAEELLDAVREYVGEIDKHYREKFRICEDEWGAGLQ